MIEQVKKVGENYQLPARLVHNLIRSIFGSILVIGGYMIIWAINDAAWKAALDVRIGQIEETLKGMDMAGVLPRADERLRALEGWRQDHNDSHSTSP